METKAQESKSGQEQRLNPVLFDSRTCACKHSAIPFPSVHLKGGSMSSKVSPDMWDGNQLE